MIFFIPKIKKLKAKINPEQNEDALKNIKKRDIKFSFEVVPVEHVERIIGKMKNSGSFGIDGISTKVMKEVKTEVAPSLSVLINSCQMNDVYPKQLKKAVVTPLFKNKGSRKDKANYRPVSNLSAPGKVLEIAASIQIVRYCERVGILGAHQHGFRSGRSTTSAVVSSMIKWQSAKEKGKFTGSLMYDLSAAPFTITKYYFPTNIDRKGRTLWL